MLIVIAQIIQSIQMVVEEKFVAGQDIPPLQAVGWEGKKMFYFLFIIVSIGLIIFRTFWLLCVSFPPNSILFHQSWSSSYHKHWGSLGRSHRCPSSNRA